MGEAEYIGHLVENLLMGIAPTLLEWKHEQDKILYNVPHRTCALIAQSVEHSAVTRHHLALKGDSDSEVTERSRDRNSLGAILFSSQAKTVSRKAAFVSQRQSNGMDALSRSTVLFQFLLKFNLRKFKNLKTTSDTAAYPTFGRHQRALSRS